MDTLIARLGLALSIGLLVGLERGWQEREAPEGSKTAGMRTFGISGLLGGVLAALAQTLNSPMVFAIGFLGFAVTLGVFKLREARSDSDYSVTTVMAAPIFFAGSALAIFHWRQDKPFADVPASNPFEIGPRLIFATIFAAAAIASAVLVSRFGSSGLLATSALTGTVDVDVAVLAALQVGRNAMPIDVIGEAILIAMATNALCRAGIATVLGPSTFSKTFAALTITAGAAASAVHTIIAGT